MRLRFRRNSDTVPPQIAADLDRIEVVSARATRLVEDLLDVARTQLGTSLELSRQPTDLVVLTRDIVAEQFDRSDRHQIVLESLVAEAVGRCDRDRLERVIANLVDNARKYSPDGGIISVRLDADRQSPGWIVLTVEDQGIGIPPEDQERIFERFQRGSNVAGRISGTGIGLAVARQIIEAHGGSIRVSSEPGQGTTFEIRLPSA
jgi:signal transduction histidine kinase